MSNSRTNMPYRLNSLLNTPVVAVDLERVGQLRHRSIALRRIYRQRLGDDGLQLGRQVCLDGPEGERAPRSRAIMVSCALLPVKGSWPVNSSKARIARA